MSLKRQEPLYEQVYEFLWSQFLSGEIRPHAHIGDVEWAERLNISRTPVREALRKIAHEGIIEPQDNGRYLVREFKPEDLHNLYRCRAALEGITASDAASRISPKCLRRLKTLVEGTESAIVVGDDRAASACNTEFHDVIIKTSANDYAVRLLAFLRRTILFSRFSILGKTTQDVSAKEKYLQHLRFVVEDHRSIIEALEAHDPNLAEARMRNHLQRTSSEMAAIAQGQRNEPHS